MMLLLINEPWGRGLALRFTPTINVFFTHIIFGTSCQCVSPRNIGIYKFTTCLAYLAMRQRRGHRGNEQNICFELTYF
jgi:hypothetical protein